MRFAICLLTLATAAPAAAQDHRRPIALEDLTRLRDVLDPQLSPDGSWVAYTVSGVNRELDEHTSDLWMTGWDGRATVRLTSTPKASEHTPRWSPDGRHLAFLSDRGEGGSDQLWLLSRRGGEAEQLTSLGRDIEDYAWSPNGDRLVLVIPDDGSVEVTEVLTASPEEEPAERAPPPRDTAGRNTPPPLVIDRYHFKTDQEGYLRNRRRRLYLFALDTRQLVQLTYGAADDRLPAWSPDGQYLVFTSKRVGEDPDRHDNWDLWVIQAAPGAVPRQLTTFTGPDAHPEWESPPAWSPDGRTIAYLQGGPDSLIYYAGPRLATLPWGGSAPPALLTAALDRHVFDPRWSADGKSLYFRLEDDRSTHLARIPAGGGAIERLAPGRHTVRGLTSARDGRVATLLSSPDSPARVMALDSGAYRPLSTQNDSLLATLRLAPVEEVTARSRDGTTINGFLVRPTDYAAGTRYPAVLWLHGGPVSQFSAEFHFWWQLLASEGYTVIGMNPRGSSGRGEKFSLGIWADWGNRDVQDVLAGVDHAVAAGIADPARLGVGGWSYGGMLTNYVIARDPRFQAAVSGAGISNILAGYGTDQYVREYEKELGTPWKHTDRWLKLSFPFLKADRITTPTLFMCGEKDLNVPLLNSEQMYQALRSLNVPTRLVVYPGESHDIERPSYQRHRFGQWLAWYGEYLRRQ
ncbi:MAG: S9 family peptidase [Gemmatimonadota bacterium]|nr:S9 family peptidase [Gemmatimonadota bacterium]